MQPVSTLTKKGIGLFFPVSFLCLFCFISSETSAQYVQYCVPPTASDCSDGAITNVTLGTLNNSSGCSSSGYTDFSLDPNVTVPVLAPGDAPGTPYTIAVTVANSTTPQTVAVWINDSHDGEFDNFEYYFLGTTMGGTLTGIVYILGDHYSPFGNGLTEMRIRTAPSSSQMTDGDACTAYTTGETEDYKIDISPFTTACSGMPAPTNTISTASPICPYGSYVMSLENPGNGTGMSYQWQHSLDNITYYDLIGETGSRTAALALPSSQWFRAIIRCGNDSVISTPFFEEVVVTPACYCVPANSVCQGGNAITNITLGTLNNSSGCSSGGYTDYSSNSSINIPDVPKFTPFSITISGGIPGSKVGVWIDNDHNGGFDQNEYTFIGDATGSPITNNITIQNGGSFTGQTRIRVRIESGDPMTDIDACTNYTNAETEDYTVNIFTGTCPNTIVAQPEPDTLCEGADHTFSVVATGPGLTYQWQESTNGCIGTFADIPGAVNPDYTITGFTAAQNLHAFRCIVTGACNILISNCALVQLYAPAIFPLQPQDLTVCEGGSAVFPSYVWPAALGYQWQVSTDGGTTFNDISGATNDTLSISTVTAADNGNQYHLLAYGCSGTPIISNNATLTINISPVIAQQPLPVTTCAGGSAGFYVSVNGVGYNYQWQVSTDGGATFNNIAGAVNDSLYINPVTAGENGNLYQVIVSGVGCSSTTVSIPALLTVSYPVFVQQPVSVSVCENQQAYFSASVTGGITGIQWQESTDGGATFNDMLYPWAMTYNLQFYVSSQDNGHQYRLAITGCGVVSYSNIVTLTVNPQPLVTITANPPVTTLSPGESTVLTASVSPAGVYNYSWLLDGNLIAGASSENYTVSYGSPGNYHVIVASVPANCYDTSGYIIITDSANGGRYSGQLHVYSNPSNGVFTVTYPALPINSSIAVFDSRGFRMNVKASIHFNEPIRVDMSTAPAGVYILTIINSTGERLATGKIIIVH